MITRSIKKKYRMHTLGWNIDNHYCQIGGQCGQSCPCCRANIYNNGIDPDAKFGACKVCLINNNKKKTVRFQI